MPRDGAGNFELEVGNPVVAGTTISTNWANPTLDDIAQALSDSLDRYGRGSMLAPFNLGDGTESLPGLAFTLEPSTGMYRVSPGIIGFSANGNQRLRIDDNNASVVATGNLIATQRLLTSDGTIALPGVAFTNEPSTGVWLSAPGVMELGTLAAPAFRVNNGAAEVWNPDDTEWVKINAYGSILVQPTAPPATAAFEDSLWWNTNTGDTYLLYNDGDSVQWVLQSSPTFTGDFLPRDGSRPMTDTLEVDLRGQTDLATEGVRVIRPDIAATGTMFALYDETNTLELFKLAPSGDVRGSRNGGPIIAGGNAGFNLSSQGAITVISEVPGGTLLNLVAAPGAAGNLITARDSTNDILFQVASAGYVNIKPLTSGSSIAALSVDMRGQTIASRQGVRIVRPGAAHTGPMIAIANEAITANVLTVSPAGTIQGAAQGVPPAQGGNGGFNLNSQGAITVVSEVASLTMLNLIAAPAATGNIIAGRDSANNILFKVGPSGAVTVAPTLGSAVTGLSVTGPGTGVNIISLNDSLNVNQFRITEGATTSLFAQAIYNDPSAVAANVAVSASGRMQLATSSLRYKENVRDYTRGLSDLMQLRPVSFESKASIVAMADKDDPNTGKTYAGLIAEDLAALGMTEYVELDNERRPNSINYASMVALLVSAIKELTARVEALENP